MKNEKINVLLIDGFAKQYLPMAKAFRKLNCNVHTIVQSHLDVAYFSRYTSKKYLLKKSMQNEENLKSFIIGILKAEKIDIVISLTDFSSDLISRYKHVLSQYSYIAIPDFDIYNIARNKKLTLKTCEKIGVPFTKTYFDFSFSKIDMEMVEYPLVAKPISSYGSIGFRVIKDINQFKRSFNYLKENIEEILIQEYVPQTSIQYEASLFLDEEQNVKSAVLFTKNRWFPVDGGSSTLNITTYNSDIINHCTKLLKDIKWTGCADIDLIHDPRNNEVKVMEINPRVSGSVKIVFLSGVNLAKQILDLYLGNIVTQYDNYKTNVRLRASHTDLLWFINSPQRFKSKPSWFSLKRTRDHIFDILDPVPWFTFTLQSMLKYRKEMKLRRRK